MFDSWFKTNARRAALAKNRPDSAARTWHEIKRSGVWWSVALAAVFAGLASCVVMLRDNVVPYRPGQYVLHAIVSRVDFTYRDKNLFIKAERDAREAQPRVYQPVADDPWAKLTAQLTNLPERVAARQMSDLPADLRELLGGGEGALTQLQQYGATPQGRENYAGLVKDYVESLKTLDGRPRIVLPAEQWQVEAQASRAINVVGIGVIRPEAVFSTSPREEFINQIYTRSQAIFPLSLQPKIAAYTIHNLQPTHVLDEGATTDAQNKAAGSLGPEKGSITYKANQIVVQRGKIEEQDWQKLQAENNQFIASIRVSGLKSWLGMTASVCLLTIAMSAYTAKYQPKIVRNHARGVAIAGLLLSMLLVAELAGIGSGSLYIFGIAPTILVAMILAIAYDRRFALGMAMMHAILVTLGLGQGISFFLILWVGVLTCIFLLDDLRTRSKLIEVSGLTAIAMAFATAASGEIALDPMRFVLENCMHVAAAGLGVGFVVLGILPFIEKAFKITTSMTLLELADASQPLLRRLAFEAPGTYQHSLQVAVLSEAAAESIGINSLLCRVGAYYHDIGKINKADYFVENQVDGHNRHINLSPSVSLLIIIGHVKDGVEMAKEYGLPTSLLPFIQQHHGTTLVEYFYHQACTQQEKAEQLGDAPAISEQQYRYPGPKPKSKEAAIVMLSDAAESATRAMSEHNANRIEALVKDLAMKRLHDGQFDDCDLTMKDLAKIQKALIKTLLGIYHGRIAYPSSRDIMNAPVVPAIRTA